MKRSFNLKSLSNMKITFLGVSYRSNVGDTRYSRVEKLYNFCKKDGADITLHDPYVSFWEELNLKVSQDLFATINQETDIFEIIFLDFKISNSFFSCRLRASEGKCSAPPPLTSEPLEPI